MFRKIIFWSHLVLGLLAGIIIAISAFTGATMAFEKQIIAWAERDLRQVAVPTNGVERVALADILADIREAQPGARPQEIIVARDPNEVIRVSLGRTNVLYVNPYTGEFQPQGAQKTREFFQLMLRWHRWLGVSPQPRAEAVVSQTGTNSPPADGPPREGGGLREFTSTVVGVSTCIFLALCISGLILWWPRTLKFLRQVIWLRRGLTGKARDWNWHNVFGFWSLPILILTTFTGIVMAFHAVGDWIYKRPANENAGLTIAVPEPGTRPFGPDELLVIAQKEVPQWESITLRLGARRQRGGGGGEPRMESAAPRSTNNVAASVGENSSRREGRSGEARAPQPVSIAVNDGVFPVPVQLTLNPYTGEILRKESLADYSPRRAFRTLNRSLHTGEVGGLFTQALSFGACIGALILVWTGFALSWRRFFKRKA